MPDIFKPVDVTIPAKFPSLQFFPFVPKSYKLVVRGSKPLIKFPLTFI